MAYDITLSIAIDSTRESGTLSDDTVFTSPVRSAVRVFADAFKVDFESTETAVTLTSNTGDAQTVSSWTFPYDISSDGYWKYRYVIIKDEYSALTSYDIYDAVFDASDDAVYRSKQNANIGNVLADTTYWELISNPAELASNFEEPSESTNIESLVYVRVLSANAAWGYANLIGENCTCTECDDEIIQPYQIASLWLNGMSIADTRSEVLKGENLARRYQSKFLSDC